VAGPPPQADSLENQRNYVYETRFGDLNGDNLIDVYVNRTAGGQPGNGSLERFIMVQTVGGKFTTLVPTSAQTTTASGWVSQSINKGLDDINFDGYADLVLQLSNKIPGALDQIVYAPAQGSGSAAKGIKAVDPEFRKFIKDLTRWIKKPRYFQNGAPQIQVPIFNYVQQCVSYCDYSHTNVQTCFMVPIVVGWTQGYDYSGFSQPALSFGQIVNQAGRGTLSPESAGQLKQILEAALGVSILAADDCGCGYPDWTWPDAERNEWLARLLHMLLEISFRLPYVEDEPSRTFYHYTPRINAELISSSGTLISNKPPYLVYMTNEVIPSRMLAFNRLALDFVPDVGFILDTDVMGPPEPIYAGIVQRGDQGQQGGAEEYVKASPVPVGSPPRIFNLGP
jgi:hypothetical protein